MNRRDFLQILPPLPSESEFTLLRFARRAMATTFEVVLPWGTPHAEAAATAVLDHVDRLEQQLSVYRDTSEVSRLNRLAAVAPVPLEAGLFGLLTLAARITANTGGAFDVTAGPLVKAWGFFRRQGRVPEEAELAAALANVGMALVELDSARRVVRFCRRGMEINLGSIGKGYALDRVAEGLRLSWGIHRALLNGGTSSILALGSPPDAPEGWPVGLKHPWQRGRLATVRLRDRAMATSGATHQHFDYNGRRLGHLLDPRTGRPADGISLAAAFAPTAAEADGLATAFYVLGIEPTRRYCAEHPDVGAILFPNAPGTALEVINLAPTDVNLDETEVAAEDDTCWDLA